MDKDKMNGGKLQYYSYLRLPNMIKSKNHSGWSSKEIPGPHPLRDSDCQSWVVPRNLCMKFQDN